ncbi:hypothetical protein [Halalkalibacterium halodurans]|uniref:hypothetical protein n=1 Tax=Halalkalibacterium halodurans TaxID=86665 RepID=UPI002AAA58F6|nr:hypothetical protein [Halalkalibacterium halodurans]MDY7220758.1 hypothetical protein [Halalkalibacterium halodurans]MDY7239997.1 hypothetical protein [Halalkalibacterium halodurans]
MLGCLFNEKEAQEIEYLLKREMEELLLDLSDPRIDEVVKRAMEEKYRIVYGIYKRFVPPNERMRYMLKRYKRKGNDF